MADLDVGATREVEETEEEMRRRHKQEARQLEGQTRAMLKKAQKKQKAQVEEEVKKMESDLADRHAKELQRFATTPSGEDTADGSEEKAVRFAPSASGADTPQQQGVDDESGDTEAEAVARKREKAKKKRDRKAQKEAEREAEIEEAKKGIVSMRDVELAHLRRILSPEGYGLLEVPADGHCMYRAVVQQLVLTGGGENGISTFAQVRKAAADYMRQHPEDFLPFIEGAFDTGDAAEIFEAYCDKVESTAEWGGQLELRALCHALQYPIIVYSADAPVLEMGAEYAAHAPPLRLSFHRHYLALGEHYNAVVPVASRQPDDDGNDHQQEHAQG